MLRLYYLGPDSIAWSGTSNGTFSDFDFLLFRTAAPRFLILCFKLCDAGRDLNTSEFVCERVHAMLKLQTTSATFSRILSICLEIVIVNLLLAVE